MDHIHIFEELELIEEITSLNSSVMYLGRVKDTRTLHAIQAQLNADMESCATMLTGHGDDDPDLIYEMESMCEELEIIEELTSLKSPVSCHCFYHLVS